MKKNFGVLVCISRMSSFSCWPDNMILYDSLLGLEKCFTFLSVFNVFDYPCVHFFVTYYFQGLEDHLGDMDFKIAGTRNGITAIQLDIKPAGIPLDIICECLEPAYKGRLQILDHMDGEINVPRIQDCRFSPQICKMSDWSFNFFSLLLVFWHRLCVILRYGVIFFFFLFFSFVLVIYEFFLKFYIDAVTLKYSNDVIRRLIGPLGSLKRKIEEETGDLAM